MFDFSESKLQTSHIRWVLWQHSLYLFHENILLGTGVGSLKYIFRALWWWVTWNHEKDDPHPHNEILRWMVEGGVVGIAAILLVIIGSGYLLYSSLKNKIDHYLLVIALPIVFHMMTEFPLWLSIPHGVVLILLIRCADIPTKKYHLNKIVRVLFENNYCVRWFVIHGVAVFYFANAAIFNVYRKNRATVSSFYE
ncbi:O-antigen ligase family protein [Providencia hangzhouensis]|uniref:O-antigen ligase family protein n=1 Tax=Providencia hangzhouensis TaxID=3031799 RepID=UPI0034DD923E